MARAPTKSIQSLRKLRKQIKNPAKRPSPKQIHTLRTRTRRVEALVHAFRLDRKQQVKRLLNSLQPIRKKAGRVRDMDVLIGFATTLSSDDEEQCLVRLIEHLGALRVKSAKKLRETVAKYRKPALRHLKRCSKLVEKQASKPAPMQRRQSGEATATALEVWTELSTWPQLNATNLHPFRLKVKELRYILQLAKIDKGKFFQALGEVKDAIGEWHDWNELAAIEAGLLDHGPQCSLRKQIRSTTKAKLNEALATANRMRKNYHHSEPSHGAPF